MTRLIFTVLLILAGYVGYTYFFGKGNEKAQAESIVQETKELGKAIGDLLKNKKEDYDSGKFDENIQKLSDEVEKLKKEPDQLPQVSESLKEVENQLKNLDTTYLSREDRMEIERVIRMVQSMYPEK